MDILIEKNRMVPMRDGVKLATDIYRPNDNEVRPALIIRLPYNKEWPAVGNSPDFDKMRMVQAGYVVIIQDCRGQFASEGEYSFIFQDAQDGADTIKWSINQPWSNGKVGGWGGSYLGSTAWAAASTTPPALLAMSTAHTPASIYGELAYPGGAFQLGGALGWAIMRSMDEQQRRLEQGKATEEDMQRTLEAVNSVLQSYEHLPISDMPALEGVASYYFDWLNHPTYDDYWKAISFTEKYEQITVPGLHIAGWYDIFLAGNLTNYQGMRARGGSEAARRYQQLIIGPWAHVFLSGLFPERYFGPTAGMESIDLIGRQLRWYDRFIRGIENGVESEKRVKIFVMGLDQWRDEEEWPLPDTSYTPYYLHSQDRANSAAGDGLLSTQKPHGQEEPADTYIYDPANPVSSLGGNTLMFGLYQAGPFDQRSIETRPDVLCYTTPPLEKAVEVTGPIELILYVSSSTLDTDFTGKLIDVHLDGRAENLCDGILRASYRESFEKEILLDPGQVYELHIDLLATSNVFKTGHRIRLEVSSSNFPKFNLNTNTGGTIAQESEADFLLATNRVFHDKEHPSHLLLPIIERD